MPQHTLVGEVSQITASSWLSPAIPAWVSTWQIPEILYFYPLFLNLDSVSQIGQLWHSSALGGVWGLVQVG